MKHEIQTDQPFDQYIDRFLFADGWRVTGIEAHTDPASYEVTLTKTIAPELGRSVSRHASNPGEATFMACSAARRT